MRKRRQQQGIPPEIKALGKRINKWRRTRPKRSFMPEELWQEAARVACTYGVSLVSRELGVSYTSLKQRALANDSRPQRKQAKALGFVELNPAPLFQPPQTLQTVLELSDREGRRMTLRLAPDASLDVRALVEGFRGLGVAG